jgi:hypothetical protein
VFQQEQTEWNYSGKLMQLAQDKSPAQMNRQTHTPLPLSSRIKANDLPNQAGYSRDLQNKQIIVASSGKAKLADEECRGPVALGDYSHSHRGFSPVSKRRPSRGNRFNGSK